ncbi:hypothetical protein O1611_g6148 [Lasiodiplodia mahajangana]|uniref:Uncharacterized protein n=1 Tax=Lasiodiplodia mahajangana TaxID=1108764 RepID=A0ACC2JJ02_9PEZI|nr:hypothetical protein O1611_g6148 [Lasiodiplodia mahajangana]
MSKPPEYAGNFGAEQPTLRILTEGCLDLFDQCVAIPNLSLRSKKWFENNLARLRRWAVGFGVQKVGIASLDYCLEGHDAVRKVISNLLDGIAVALKHHLASGSEQSREVDSTSNDEHPKDLVPIDFELTDGSRLDGTGEIDTMLGEQAYYINMLIRSLARLSLLIGQSGDKFRHKLADADLDNADSGLVSEYEQFRNYLITKVLWTGSLERALLIKLGAMITPYPYATAVKVIIRAWLKNRLTPVQTRLIQANVMRRHRLRFARGRSGVLVQEKPAALPVDKPAAPSQSQIEPGKSKPESSATTGNSRSATPKAPVPRHADRAPDDHTAAGVRSELSASPNVTRTGQTLDYPTLPNLESDPRCPYCSFVLTPEHGSSKDKWRDHLAHDLSPYTCVFEDCDSPLGLYVKREEWMNHIRINHSVTQWTCSLCFNPHEGPYFTSVEEWNSHMKGHHAGHFEREELSLLCNAEKRRIIPPVSCPLCLDDRRRLQLENNDHIAEHLEQFSLYALQWDIGEDDDTRDTS